MSLNISKTLVSDEGIMYITACEKLKNLQKLYINDLALSEVSFQNIIKNETFSPIFDVEIIIEAFRKLPLAVTNTELSLLCNSKNHYLRNVKHLDLNGFK